MKRKRILTGALILCFPWLVVVPGGNLSSSGRSADDETPAKKATEKKKKKAAPRMDPVSRKFLFPSSRDFLKPAEQGLEARDVSFKNRSGSLLRGWFFDREGTDRTVLVCMGNTGNISVMLPYARILLDGGFDVLLFDYQGFGGSEGVASVMSLTGDASAAFDYLTATRGLEPGKIGILGTSLGSVLALFLGSQRQPRAVAVEDVFLPADHLKAFKKSAGNDPLAGWAITALERFVLPAVDPLSTAKRVRCPLLLVHGERDWLLPPWGSARVASVREAPTRVWLMDGVGHAPESLEMNDREFAHQLQRFFSEVFEGGGLDDPRVAFDVTSRGDSHTVELTIESPRRQALQVALAGENGEFHFLRRFVDAGTTKLATTVSFSPQHASAIAFRHVRDLGGGRWEEDLSPLSAALRAFKAFERGIDAQSRKREFGVVRRGDAAFVVRRYVSRQWEWARERLPAAARVHERMRPRYASLLADIAMGISGDGAKHAVHAAEAMVPFLPDDPDRYYEFGNATFKIGLQSWALAESAFLVARKRLEGGRVKEARDLLRRYLKLLPGGSEPRIRAEEIEGLTAGSDLDP